MGALLYKRGPSAASASGTVGIGRIGALTSLDIGITVSAASGTTPTCTFFVEYLGADGNWYVVWKSSQITAAAVISASVGPGAKTPTASPPDATLRLRWAIGGTTPSFTFSASITAR